MLAFGLVVVLVLHTWVAQPFVIPSGSMENTLEIGDRVLVNKPWPTRSVTIRSA
ncbi:S26 family signal peptidase [Yinghuangia aomiensis]